MVFCGGKAGSIVTVDTVLNTYLVDGNVHKIYTLGGYLILEPDGLMEGVEVLEEGLQSWEGAPSQATKVSSPDQVWICGDEEGLLSPVHEQVGATGVPTAVFVELKGAGFGLRLS